MEPVNRKITTTTKAGGDIPSPVLIRRRLSAPETVMRKYKLARAKSQESDSGHDQPNCDLYYESHSGSDLNLQKKKESAVLMRKSTLLRRLMNNPKTLGSSSFQEWQHYCGKLSNTSLNSLQGSPEHLSKSYSRRSLVGYEFRTSPKHNSYGSRKVSPVRQSYDHHQNSLLQMNTSPKRRIDTHSDSYSNHHSYSTHGINGRMSSMSSLKTNGNSDSSVTTSRTTILKDHLHSAYSNEKPNVTPTSISSSSTNTNLTAQENIRHRKSTSESIPANLDHRIVDENRNFPMNASFNYMSQETATQTASTTNLNVISNVKLSQKTLDLIVNEVMRDVQKTYTNGNEVMDKLGDSVHVRDKPGSENKPFGNLSSYEQEEIRKYSNNSESRVSRMNSSRLSTISNKTLGAKSEKFTDDNSDIASLADSLDDSTSSRISIRHHDNKPVRGDVLPLTSNDNKTSMKSIKPADAFFIPMKTDIQKDVKSVSNYLPKKLREKILQRQQDLQEKLSQSKSTFKSKLTHLSFQKSKKNFVAKSEKLVDTKLDDIQGKSRSKKPFLPSINLKKKYKQPSDEENSEKPKSKARHRKKTKDDHQSTKRNKECLRERDFNLYTTENEYVYDGGPKRIYHRAEFRNCHKRVEILEILECVDITARYNQDREKVRSKIPVSVNPKPTRHRDSISRKPTYLDFDKVYLSDPKLDQLIANILIQTLNERVDSKFLERTNNEQTRQQEFEHISEETSQQSSNDDSENRNTNEISTNLADLGEIEGLGGLDYPDKVSDHSKFHQQPLENMYYKGKAAVELLRSENSSTIPDGWVAFYVPQRSEETLDNGSFEGKKSDICFEPDVKTRYAKSIKHSVDELRHNAKLSDHEEDHMQSSTNEMEGEYQRIRLPPPIAKRCELPSRSSRYKEAQTNHCLPAEWSIVLSGKNNPSCNSDLEMKIRFPSSRQNVNLPPQLPSESEENRENQRKYEKKSRFPRIDEKYLNYNTKKDYYGRSNGRVQNLPEVNFDTETSNRRMSGSIASLRAMEITDIRPRQTKTSLKRYNMTRPKLHPLFESNIYDFNIDRQYPDILRRIPHFLAVNGNSLSSERKHRVPGMSRKDIPKHNCTPH